MKKKFIALLLVTLMLFSGVLTSCSDTVEFDEDPAKVYTLYTIAEEGTTQEGIRATRAGAQPSGLLPAGISRKARYGSGSGI